MSTIGRVTSRIKGFTCRSLSDFNDTQKVGYLVNALRHEKEWDYVCSAITSAQIKCGYTFHVACNELKFRCEASRANELMDKPVKGKRVKGLVSKSTKGATRTRMLKN